MQYQAIFTLSPAVGNIIFCLLMIIILQYKAVLFCEVYYRFFFQIINFFSFQLFKLQHAWAPFCFFFQISVATESEVCGNRLCRISHPQFFTGKMFKNTLRTSILHQLQLLKECSTIKCKSWNVLLNNGLFSNCNLLFSKI